MVDPVTRQLFDIEQCHCVDYGVAVSASGGEEAIDMSPAIAAVVPVAPEPGPGATASPDERALSLRPEPVSTAFSTVGAKLSTAV